jgi:hypothetical protein
MSCQVKTAGLIPKSVLVAQYDDIFAQNEVLFELIYPYIIKKSFYTAEI